MKGHKFTGDKTKNCFTAYLQKAIRWRRYHYLIKKANISNAERIINDSFFAKYSNFVEEIAELYSREELLFKEYYGKYPRWEELSDQKLVDALMQLRENERRIIYHHVFEERSFGEIEKEGLIGMTKERIKEVYYYAIRKIRRHLRGEW